VWYLITALIIFLLGIKPFIKCRKKHDIENYKFAKFDENDYAQWLLEWFATSLIFPIFLLYILLFVFITCQSEDTQ